MDIIQFDLKPFRVATAIKVVVNPAPGGQINSIFVGSNEKTYIKAAATPNTPKKTYISLQRAYKIVQGVSS